VRAEPTLTEPGACVTEVPEPDAGAVAAGAALALLGSRAGAGRGALARRG